MRCIWGLELTSRWKVDIRLRKRRVLQLCVSPWQMLMSSKASLTFGYFSNIKIKQVGSSNKFLKKTKFSCYAFGSELLPAQCVCNLPQFGLLKNRPTEKDPRGSGLFGRGSQETLVGEQGNKTGRGAGQSSRHLGLSPPGNSVVRESQQRCGARSFYFQFADFCFVLNFIL